MGLIEIGSAWMPGRAVGPSPNGEQALTCWERARTQLVAAGRDTKDLIVHQAGSDQDAVFTSSRRLWLRALLIESEVRVSHSERGAGSEGQPLD